MNPVPAYNVNGFVNNQPAQFVLDTGAAVTLLQRRIWDQMKQSEAVLEPWTGQRLVGVEGTPLQVCGTVQVELKLGEEIFQTRVVVVDGLTVDVILGLDFLETHSCTVDIGRKTLHFTNRGTSVILHGSQGRVAAIGVTISKTLQVPAYSEMEVMANMAQPKAPGTWIMEGDATPVMVARSLLDSPNTQIPVRLMNPSDQPVTLYKGKRIATLEPVEETPGVAIAGVQPKHPQVSEEKQETLWKLVDSVGESLSETNREELFCLLMEYADIFAHAEEDLGRMEKVQHQINTGSSAPIRQQVRRIPPAKRVETRKLLKEMLERDVIQPTNSPWASPIVLVQKKDGSTRFCVDYRKVNSVTRKDAYPLPRVDDTLDTLAGSKWFSTLDLLSGYWQVEVHPEDRQKTAFCTPDGLFEFKVMPFGLCNAPATFQRLMDTVLAGLQWTNCLVYLDDVIT